MFRNLRLYRLFSPWPANEQALSDLLQMIAFNPCPPFTERSAGWEPPGLRHDSLLCRRINGADLLRLRCQSRILPAPAIREALETRLEDYRSRMGEEPSRRVIRKLREETRDELLPKALLKSDRLDGFCLPTDGILGIDTGSTPRAELFLDLLRAALQGGEFEPLQFNRPVGEWLTAMFLGDLPDGFSLGHDCRMQDPADARATATWKDVDLGDPAIRTHVIDGMQLTHLAIDYRQVMQCVISYDGVLSKIRFTGADVPDAGVAEHPLATQDTEFVLATGTLRSFFRDMQKVLGGFANTDRTLAAA